jgi:hypothetical protein
MVFLLSNPPQVFMNCLSSLSRFLFVCFIIVRIQWLAATNVDRQMSLSFSLLRLNLRNQRATVRRFLQRRQEIALGKWRLNVLARKQSIALAKAVKACSSLGKAWRVWLAQVWTFRFLSLKEKMAARALEEVRKLQAVAADELGKMQKAIAPSTFDHE